MHPVHKHLHFGAVSGILGRGLRIAQHGGKFADIGTGGEGRRSVAGDNESPYSGIIFVAGQHIQNLVGNLVIERIHGLGAADGNNLNPFHIIN